MAIDYVEIENFQRHESYRIDFDPRLTTIIGQTDAGKSSLLRAIRWVALNLPDGDSFIRHGSNGAVAKLGVDGHEIIRKRLANGENKYYLDGQEFSSFGRSVPDRIAAVLQIDRINFVGQIEPPFWFSLPPVEVARQLNAIVDLGVIDEAMEAIGRQLRQRQDAVKSASERMVASRTERDSLEWVELAERDLTAVEAVWVEVEQIEREEAALSALLEDIKRYESERIEAEKLEKAVDAVGRAGAEVLKDDAQITALQALLDDICRLAVAASYSGDITALCDAVADYDAASEQIERLTALIDEIKRAERNAAIPIGDFDAIESVYLELQSIDEKERILSVLMADIARQEAHVAQVTKEEAELHAELEKATVGKCPVCGQEIP